MRYTFPLFFMLSLFSYASRAVLSPIVGLAVIVAARPRPRLLLVEAARQRAANGLGSLGSLGSGLLVALNKCLAVAGRRRGASRTRGRLRPCATWAAPTPYKALGA